MAREALPIEDRDEGLYINQPHKSMAGVEVTTISVGGEDRYLVSAEDFMAVQKERDEHKRTLALINAWAIRRDGDPAVVRRLLDQAGFTFDDGCAMASIIASVRTAPASQLPATEGEQQ
jgi:hypothetical protein